MRTAPVCKRAPAAAGRGPLGHKRNTKRSVVISGVNFTSTSPLTWLLVRSTLMCNKYCGRDGGRLWRAGTAGHVNDDGDDVAGSVGRGALADGALAGALDVVGATEVEVVDEVGGAPRSARFAAWPEWHAAAMSATATKAAANGRRLTPSIVGCAVMAPTLTPTCVWRATPQLVVALDEQFGEPVDAYVNGSQVWLRDDGPNGIALEWRLHPVAGYQRPPGVDTYSVFADTAVALATGAEPPAPLETLWDGLECFAAYADEVEPAGLAAAATASLGITPDAAGVVDHERIGNDWERSGRRISIVEALLEQLGR